MKKESKRWYQSKTIWLNIISPLLLILPLIDVNLLTVINVSDPKKYYTLVVFFTAVLNIILRSLNTKNISKKKSI